MGLIGLLFGFDTSCSWFSWTVYLRCYCSCLVFIDSLFLWNSVVVLMIQFHLQTWNFIYLFSIENT